MIRYVIKRILMLIPLVFCITFVVYGLMSLAPGDPATVLLPSNAPQEQKDALNHELEIRTNKNNGPVLNSSKCLAPRAPVLIIKTTGAASHRTWTISNCRHAFIEASAQ